MLDTARPNFQPYLASPLGEIKGLPCVNAPLMPAEELIVLHFCFGLLSMGFLLRVNAIRTRLSRNSACWLFRQGGYALTGGAPAAVHPPVGGTEKIAERNNKQNWGT